MPHPAPDSVSSTFAHRHIGPRADDVLRMLETVGSPNASVGDGVIERLKVLASRVAELHVALARRTGDAAFDPEPVGADDVARWIEAVQRDVEQTFEQLSRHDIGSATAPVGALVRIERDSGTNAEGEVIGFRDGRTLVYLLTATTGVRRGNRATLLRTTRTVPVGPALLGRVIDARGRCIDGRPRPLLPHRVRSDRTPPAPIDRPRIRTPLATGVHAIDAMLTCGRGQRLGGDASHTA